MKIIVGLITSLVLVIVLCVVLGAVMLNSQWFQEFIETTLSETIGQKVSIDSIKLNLGHITRLRVEQISVANPSWASKPYLASVEVLEVGIDLSELLVGDLVFTEVQIIKPVFQLEKSAQNKANWVLTEESVSSPDEQDLSKQDKDEGGLSDLPRIKSLSVDNGRLTYRDSTQDTSVTLSIESHNQKLSTGQNHEVEHDDSDRQAKIAVPLTDDSFQSDIIIEGNVKYQGIPIDVLVRTGSTRQGIEDYREWPIDAKLQIRETTMDLDAQIGSLWPLESLTTTFRVAGPDLFRLGEAINIPLPHLPPYDLQAQLQRKLLEDGKQIFLFKSLDGTIGDSDVAGELRLTIGGERPMIFTHLQSRMLDLDDLAGLTGAQPDPEETASTKQKVQAEKNEDRKRLLPDKPLDFSQLKKVDADVDYRAKNVQAPNLPLDDFVLVMTLQNGHMQMNHLDFGVAKGTAAMKLEVNARQVPGEAKLKVDFDQMHLSQLFADSEVADDSFGKIGGKGTLWMHGQSLANWFASADGGMYFTMTGGKIDALLVELAGLDFTESATVFLGTDTGVPIDCAYSDLQARSGIVTIEPFLLDTSDTKFKGLGSIDLRQEIMDLTIKPYPKDFTLLSSRGPLHVTGTFKNPEFSVDPSFPSPEFGVADDSQSCEGMIEALRKARKNDMDHQKMDPALDK
ncbi:AsmA family protein [Candidatus Nitrospira salsa]